MKRLTLALVGALVLFELTTLWALADHPLVAMGVMLLAPVALLALVWSMR